jgi:26S proteasome regulatory subunit N6
MSRLAEADEAKEAGDVAKAEAAYHEILSKSVGSNETGLREQETALIKLGELYRDQQYTPRNAKYPLRSQKSTRPCFSHPDITGHHVPIRKSKNRQNG